MEFYSDPKTFIILSCIQIKLVKSLYRSNSRFFNKLITYALYSIFKGRHVKLKSNWTPTHFRLASSSFSCENGQKYKRNFDNKGALGRL